MNKTIPFDIFQLLWQLIWFVWLEYVVWYQIEVQAWIDKLKILSYHYYHKVWAYIYFVDESLFFFGFTILLYVATKYIDTVIDDNEYDDNNHDK